MTIPSMPRSPRTGDFPRPIGRDYGPERARPRWPVPSRMLGAALLLGLGACYSGVHDGPGSQEMGPGAEQDDAEGSAGSEEDGSESSSGLRSAAPLGIRRLSIREYNHTVEVVLGDDTEPANSWSADTTNTGYDTDVQNAWVTDQLVRQFRGSAEDVARRFAPRWSEFVDCDLEGEGELACVEALVTQIGRRLFRRPLTEAEQSQLVELFEFGRDESGFEEGVALCVQAMLQSPSFLFLSQSGREDDPTRLSDFELAARMSYFLTGGPPDDELLDAAEADVLHDQLRTQAERLLDSRAGRDTLAEFHLKWLHMESIGPKDADRFPKFTDEVREDLLKGFSRLVELHIFDPELPGTFASMLTEPVGVVSANTAYLVGAEPGAEEFSAVKLDPARRAGLLTDPAVMAALGDVDTSHPVNRGVVLMEQLMCQTFGAPPDGADNAKDDFNREELTTREFYEAVTSQAVCAGCHSTINGMGFTFEHYDGDGAWRDTELNQPIDSSGTLTINGDPDNSGEVADAIDVSERLANSKKVAECYSRQYFRYLLGRREVNGDDDDRAVLDSWAEALMSRESGAIRTFIVDLVTSETFTTRDTATGGTCE